MAISSPLDSAACSQADDVLYCKNRDDPSLFTASGGRVPLSATSPAHQPLRDLWCELYEEIVAHNRDGSHPFPSCGLDHAHHPQPCQHCLGTAAAPGPVAAAGENDSDCDPVASTEACPQKDDEDEKIRLRVSLFFDGTRNNMYNVESPIKIEGEQSYENGLSNVAILYKSKVVKRKDLDEHIWIYIEGMGTTKGEPDSLEGSAVGQGPTGIPSRVNEAYTKVVRKILNSIKKKKKKVTKIDLLEIDTFGFSRGAAAARHFVHKIMQIQGDTLKDRLTAHGYEVNPVSIRFMGLFDTVSSFGYDLRFDNVKDLGLKSVAIAKNVTHLASAEEHRVNFSLTNINSAPNGKEIFLPGVHSDVGGGYPESFDEKNLKLFDLDLLTSPAILIPIVGPLIGIAVIQNKLSLEIEWLVKSNWYRRGDIEDKRLTGKIFVNRAGIKNDYQYIPLHLMAKDAGNDAEIEFPENPQEIYPIPNDLIAFRDYIYKSIEAGECKSPKKWFGNPASSDHPLHKEARYKYLHSSAYYNIKEFSAFRPRFKDGRRFRVEYNG